MLRWNFAGDGVESSKNSTNNGKDLGNHDPSLNSSCQDENVKICWCCRCVRRNWYNAICCRGWRHNYEQGWWDGSSRSQQGRRWILCAVISMNAELKVISAATKSGGSCLSGIPVSKLSTFQKKFQEYVASVQWLSNRVISTLFRLMLHRETILLQDLYQEASSWLSDGEFSIGEIRTVLNHMQVCTINSDDVAKQVKLTFTGSWQAHDTQRHRSSYLIYYMFFPSIFSAVVL